MGVGKILRPVRSKTIRFRLFPRPTTAPPARRGDRFPYGPAGDWSEWTAPSCSALQDTSMTMRSTRFRPSTLRRSSRSQSRRLRDPASGEGIAAWQRRPWLPKVKRLGGAEIGRPCDHVAAVHGHPIEAWFRIGNGRHSRKVPTTRRLPPPQPSEVAVGAKLPSQKPPLRAGRRRRRLVLGGRGLLRFDQAPAAAAPRPRLWAAQADRRRGDLGAHCPPGRRRSRNCRRGGTSRLWRCAPRSRARSPAARPTLG